jgi:hypothetical protein
MFALSSLLTITKEQVKSLRDKKMALVVSHAVPQQPYEPTTWWVEGWMLQPWRPQPLGR